MPHRQHRPVAFGAIGVPVIVAGQVSGFDPNLISAIVGRQLPFLSVIVPLWLCVTMCGFKRSMEVLPAILVAGLCFAISQFVFSNYHGPTLPDIMSAIITLVGLVILLRFWKPATIWRFEGEKPTVLTGKATPSVKSSAHGYRSSSWQSWCSSGACRSSRRSSTASAAASPQGLRVAHA